MLTTNDVRVLRLLVERGPHTPSEVERAFRLREIQLDVTGEGARQLRRSDEAAYGRWA